MSPHCCLELSWPHGTCKLRSVQIFSKFRKVSDYVSFESHWVFDVNLVLPFQFKLLIKQQPKITVAFICHYRITFLLKERPQEILLEVVSVCHALQDRVEVASVS